MGEGVLVSPMLCDQRRLPSRPALLLESTSQAHRQANEEPAGEQDREKEETHDSGGCSGTLDHAVGDRAGRRDLLLSEGGLDREGPLGGGESDSGGSEGDSGGEHGWEGGWL